MKEAEFLTINVSGITYKLQKRTVDRIPGSLLHYLTSANAFTKLPSGVTFIEQGQEFFVQRSPPMFELIVLPCYITGKIHVPKWMCVDTVIQELKFWALDKRYACNCCGGEGEDSTLEKQNNVTTVENNELDLKKSNWQKLREAGWNILDNPASSYYALMYGIISFAMVLLSIGALISDSFQDVANCPYDIASHSFYSNYTNQNHISSTNATVMKNTSVSTITEIENRLFSACSAKRTYQIIDWITMIYFTLEIIFRLLFCPDLKKYFRSPLNIIDIFATFPFYVEIAFAMCESNINDYATAEAIFYLMQIARCLRVIRILKLARYSEELRILGDTLKSARDELFMLILFLLVTVFIFASIMYQLEKYEPESSYTSIPASCWWGIITLTTVGYGDMFPQTVAGKLIASCACVAGIIIMAFPVSIIVEHFNVQYKKKSKRMLSSATAQQSEPSFLMDDTVTHKDESQRRHSLV